MSNKEFNDFYNMLLAMDEDELEETVLKMAEPVMNRQIESEEKELCKYIAPLFFFRIFYNS